MRNSNLSLYVSLFYYQRNEKERKPVLTILSNRGKTDNIPGKWQLLTPSQLDPQMLI